MTSIQAKHDGSDQRKYIRLGFWNPEAGGIAEAGKNLSRHAKVGRIRGRRFDGLGARIA
jgi:hypothetical protein